MKKNNYWYTDSELIDELRYRGDTNYEFKTFRQM
jgi:hypothetical protein